MSVATSHLCATSRRSFERNRNLPLCFTRSLSICQLAVTLAAWYIIQCMVDKHWLGTLFGFGPKWPLLVPIVVLFPMAVRWDRWSLVMLAASTLITVFPVMGMNVPSQAVIASSIAPQNRIKVLTCNVEGKADLELLWKLVKEERPDIVSLEEWPANVVVPLSTSSGWYVARHGGIVVASRFPVLVQKKISSPIDKWRGMGLRCNVETPSGTIEYLGVHLMTPRSGIEAFMHSKGRDVESLQRVNSQRLLESEKCVSEFGIGTSPSIVAGDFNMPAKSQIYRACWGPFQNAFTESGWGWGATKYTKIHSVAIDHILVSPSMQVLSCRVASDVGSDHRPVIAEVALIVNEPAR